MSDAPQKIGSYLTGGLLLLAAGVAPSWASSSNANHELGVYNLEVYAQELDNISQVSVDWKDSIVTVGNLDAYDALFPEMFNCTADSCAHSSSFRKSSSQVTVDTLHGSTTGLNAPDMAFFFGHNISIREWNDDGDPFGAWVPWANGAAQYPVSWNWAKGNLCTNCTYDIFDWGTNVIPYYYHQRGTNHGQTGIQDANYVAPYTSYSIFYGYNPMTSFMSNQDYKSGTWYTENTVSQSTPTARSGRLGAEASPGDLEFLIANGCQAVPVRQYSSHYPGSALVDSQQAVAEWGSSWRGLHQVLGHYYSSTTGCVPNLVNFATDLKAGDGVARAYFEAHTCSDPTDPGLYQPATLTPYPASSGYWDNDKWTTQIADPTTANEINGPWSYTFWEAQ